MIKKLTIFRVNFTAVIFVFLTIAVLGPGSSMIRAQPVITAENIGLGGGGTAYLNGPEATFWNPANLMIQEQAGQFHLEIGQSAIQFEPLLSSKSVSGQFTRFLDGYQPYTQVDADMSANQRTALVNTHYPGNKLQAQNRQRGDFMIAGAIWQQNDYALSIALRARYASAINVGRGWYDDHFIEENNRQVRDFSLSQNRSEYYELAVGYAQEFTFINGLMPHLNTLYIGIAPKVILAGPAFNTKYNARYIREGEDAVTSNFVSVFNMQSSGRFSGTTSDYLKSGNPRRAIKNNFQDNYHFQQTGYGLGFDFGLSYVMRLNGRKQSSMETPAPAKSLRVAFSLNDIGAVLYNKQPLSMSSPEDTSQALLQTSMNSMFVGAGGQFVSQLHTARFLPNPLVNAEHHSEESYSSLLPTSANTGIFLDLERFKFMGDLTLGLNNTAFTTKKLAVSLGAEIRPFRHVPIRAGTRFAADQPFQMGFGTGIETTHWDFTVGARALFQERSPQTSLVGAAFGGLQFHF